MNAFMIMCHKNIPQVIRLITKLTTNESDIFIHCDSNISDNDFNILVKFINESSKNLSGHYYLTNIRLHGELDKRSLVDITIKLIEKVFEVQSNQGKHYDYFLLLSGQDYPIKSITYINEQLKLSYPTPFIDCTPFDKKNWINYKFDIKFPSTTPLRRFVIKLQKCADCKKRGGVQRKIIRFIQVIAQKFVKKQTTYKKLKKLNVKIFGGSAWWILPDIAITFIYKNYTSDNNIVKLILNESITPEETFFQTIVMMSNISNLIHINPPEQREQNCKTWAYFTDVDKPFKGHPYIFHKENFLALKNSDCWFARKFDIAEDAEIFDLIDSIL